MSHLRCILIHPEDPRNIGAAVRACANFGAQEIGIVGNELSQDDERLARVASAGAWNIIGPPTVWEGIEEAVADCSIVCGTTARSRSQPPARAMTPEELFCTTTALSKVAVLFGSESHGLTSAQCALCHVLLQVPTNPDWSSLNLAQAVLLVVYEWFKSVPMQTGAAPNVDVAPIGEQERVVTRVRECIGSQIPTRTENALGQLRRLLHHAEPSHEDISMLLNLIKQAQHKSTK